MNQPISLTLKAFYHQTSIFVKLLISFTPFINAFSKQPHLSFLISIRLLTTSSSLVTKIWPIFDRKAVTCCHLSLLANPSHLKKENFSLPVANIRETTDKIEEECKMEQSFTIISWIQVQKDCQLSKTQKILKALFILLILINCQVSYKDKRQKDRKLQTLQTFLQTRDRLILKISQLSPFSILFKYYLIFQQMNLFSSCLEASQIISSSFDDHAILTGVSDTVIVKQKNGTYKGTPFLVCFGPYRPTHYESPVRLTVNDHLVGDLKFSLDYKGYIQPQYLNDRDIRKLHLQFGVNKAAFSLGEYRIETEIYLYASNDKLVVSDVDGTVTKNDIGGHVHNLMEKDYLHEGYSDLAKAIDKNGYKIVWLTMRALPLYSYSKTYLRQTVGVDGPILMQPQEFVPALSKQLLKKTGNVKANMMNLLLQLFPSNPFMAGLGNRQNDAVAYLHAGVPLQKIFIIDTKSRVQIMNEGSSYISYRQMADNIQKYFPSYSAPKVGYM